METPSKGPQLSRRGILGGVAASYVQVVASLVVTFVGTPIYLTWLGQETYGLYLATTSWVGYLSAFRLGFPQAAGNEIAASFARSQLERVASALKTSAWMAAAGALAGALLATVLLTTGIVSSELFRGSAEVERLALPLLVTSGVGFLIALPLQQWNAGLRALQRVHVEQFVAAAVRLLGFFASIAVLALGLGVVAFAASQAAVTAVSGAACRVFVRRALPREARERARLDGALAREILRPGLGFVLLSLSGALIWGTDNVVISMFEGSAAVTPYAVSFRLITLAITWLGMGLGALGPTVTSLWASGQRQRLTRVLLEMLKLGMAGIVALGIALGFFGRDFVLLWAGPAAVVPGHMMWTFVAILLVVAFTMGFEIFLIATSNHQRYARVSLFEGLVNLALSVLLVRLLGSWGVALATLASHLCVSAWYVPVSVTRTLSLSWREIAREVLQPLLLPAAGALGAGVLCARLIPIEGWGSWALCASGQIAGFAILYTGFGLNRWEREHAGQLLAGMRRRWASP